MQIILILFTLCGIITFLGLTVFIQLAKKQKRLLDIPNHRTSHSQPTPRGGGLIFVGVWALALCLISKKLLNLNFDFPLTNLSKIALPCSFIALTGILSDFCALGAKSRLVCQGVAGIIFLVSLKPLSPLYSALALFWILWSTNLFNFMDGTDGLASTEGIFVLSLAAGLFYLHHAPQWSLVCVFMIGALLGFLFWNWPSAKVFMGETGSYTLGFLIAILVLIGQDNGISMLYFGIIYSVFCFDATLTLIRRAFKRENIFRAHKKHAFQRLHQSGWPHQKILLGLIGLNSLLLIVCFLSYSHPTFLPWGVLLAFSCLSFIYYKIELLKQF